MNLYTEKKPTGIILAGGSSKRMGMDKALLKLGGLHFIEIIYRTIAPLCSEVIISTNNTEVKIEGVRSLRDETVNSGPIGGICTCLKESKSFKNIIISVDTPFINEGLIQYIIAHSADYDAFICKHHEKLHPLVGIYTKNILNILEKDIRQERYKVLKVIEQSNWHYAEISEKQVFYNKYLFFNINTPEELKTAQAFPIKE